MHPRILLRTHYQADEPRLIIAAVTHCSNPRERGDEERIAAALERWARNNKYVISTPGAVYAVGNARHLGLLDRSNRRTASGHAFAFIEQLVPPESGPKSRFLTPMEERLYLKTYLIGAGALLVKFTTWLLERGSTTAEQLRKGSIIEHLMIDVLDDYLSLAREVRDRAAIRHEKDRLSREDYSSATKRHKRYPLLKTMLRLRLLRGNADNGEVDQIQPDSSGRLAAMSRAVPNIEELERLIRSNKLQETLDVEMREYARNDLPMYQKPLALLHDAYSFAMELGMQACPLSFLDDILRAAFPTSPGAQPLGAEQLLEPAHKESPGEVRFHVDRRGQRAFVVLSERALQGLSDR